MSTRSLQRSRRSSRRTSGGRGERPRRRYRASTEPSFFTTDKGTCPGECGGSHRASTEPSFFTTDKSPYARTTMTADIFGLQRSRRSSRRTRRPQVGCGARVLQRFNGAVVLHDGQVLLGLLAVLLRCTSLQRSRRSSRRTSQTWGTRGLRRHRLQRSRRSSRRTSRDCCHPQRAPSRRSFNGAVVLHDGQGGPVPGLALVL